MFLQHRWGSACIGKAVRAAGSGRILSRVLVLLLASLVAACGSQPVAQETMDAQRAVQEQATKNDLNRELAALAVRNSTGGRSLEQEYPVGTGDVLDVAVFQVEELNTTVRVNGKGSVILPLVGELQVGGKTLREFEELLVGRLKEFMHDPQVSVFIAEYQSQQISVTGAVNDPALHTLTRPRSVLEMLSMSGGLSESAGNQIYVHTRVDGQPQRLIIDLDEVLADPNNEGFSILLKGGDSIFVPEAGTVFVEGSVNKPGAYQLEGDTGVLEAIAMAGGPKFEAKKQVQVLTLGAGGQKEVINLNLAELRANQTASVALKDGDIVLVPESTAKAGFANFWRGLSGVFNVGYGL